MKIVTREIRVIQSCKWVVVVIQQLMRLQLTWHCFSFYSGRQRYKLRSTGRVYYILQDQKSNLVYVVSFVWSCHVEQSAIRST